MKKFLKTVKYFLQQKRDEVKDPLKSFLLNVLNVICFLFVVYGVLCIIGLCLDAFDLCRPILTQDSDRNSPLFIPICGLFSIIVVISYAAAVALCLAILGVVVITIVGFSKWIHENWQEARERVETELANLPKSGYEPLVFGDTYTRREFDLSSDAEHEKFSKQQFNKQKRKRNGKTKTK